MSRYNTTAGDDKSAGAAYGYDHALGYFVQVMDRQGRIVLDRCSLFNGLTRDDLLNIFSDHGIDVPEAHLAAIAFDLEF